jgi:hypothetical protein
MKYCKKCDIDKPSSEFNKRKSSGDGYSLSCRECDKNYQTSRKDYFESYYQDNQERLAIVYQENREDKIAKSQQYYVNNKDKVKEYWNKEENKTRKTKILKEWNEENKEHVKEYREENKEKLQLYSAEYHQNNLDKIHEYHKEYQINNRERKNIYHKTRYKNDIDYRIKCILRASFAGVIRNYNGIKSQSVLKLVGCTKEEFRKYIESLFLPEMSWDNYGKKGIWEIDHIIPCYNFDHTKLEEQKKCWYYLNLRPLFKTTEIAESFGYKDQIGNRNKNKYLK